MYQNLALKEYGANKSIEIVNTFVEDIGEKNITKILKLNHTFKEGFHYFEGNDFKIEAMVGIAGNHLKVYQYSAPIYDYRKPEEGVETLDSFLDFFSTQCRREGIKIKK